MLNALLRAAIRLFVACVGLYGAALLLYWLGRGIVGERFFVISLLNSLMPAIALPTLILLPLLLLARRWRVAAITSVTVIALILLYGGRFVPRAYTASSQQTLRVMTFNLASPTSNFDGIIAAIRAADAHLVALQEVRTMASDALTPALADLYPYRQVHPGERFAHGLVIYSKFPLSDGAYFEPIALGGQRVRVALPDGRTLIFYNGHPVPPQWRAVPFDTNQRSREISIVLDDLAAQPDGVPVIVAGDYNMTDLSEDYTRFLKAGLIDSYAQVGAGLGPTFPDPDRYSRLLSPILPLIRIDYVFYSAGWADAESAYVGAQNGGSDHFPVVVTLRLR